MPQGFHRLMGMVMWVASVFHQRVELGRVFRQQLGLVGISVSLAVRDGDSVGTGVSSAYGTGLVANGVSVGDAVEGCVVGVPVEHAANASTSPLTVTNLVNNTLASWWHHLQDFSMAETSMSVTAYV